mgnify:CR=1 FL=1
MRDLFEASKSMSREAKRIKNDVDTIQDSLEKINFSSEFTEFRRVLFVSDCQLLGLWSVPRAKSRLKRS